jgi:DNA-binding MarR family transcriptional regulator
MSTTPSPIAGLRGDDPVDVGQLGKVGAAWKVGGRDFLPYRITLLAKLLDRCTTRLLLANSGLTVAEWRALAQLVIASPASVRQLAEQAWVDRAEVSRAAASLERRGYVERRENPKDRRSPLLYCTDAGRALARQVTPSRHAFHKSLTDLLPGAQTAELEAALLVLAKHCVDQLDAAGVPLTDEVDKIAGRRASAET